MAAAIPPTAFALAWGLPALQDLGPVSPSPCLLVAKRSQGICIPSTLGEEEGGCRTLVPSYCKLEYCSAAGQAEPAWVPLGFCRYHHTAPINSFFSLREGLAMLVELVSGAGQAGGHQQCWWGLGEQWVPGPSPSSLPTGSGELMGAPPGQLHPAVPGSARPGA